MSSSVSPVAYSIAWDAPCFLGWVMFLLYLLSTFLSVVSSFISSTVLSGGASIVLYPPCTLYLFLSCFACLVALRKGRPLHPLGNRNVPFKTPIFRVCAGKTENEQAFSLLMCRYGDNVDAKTLKIISFSAQPFYSVKFTKLAVCRHRITGGRGPSASSKIDGSIIQGFIFTLVRR